MWRREEMGYKGKLLQGFERQEGEVEMDSGLGVWRKGDVKIN